MAANGGQTCPELSESKECNTAECPQPQDCVVTPWSALGACSAVCGGGSQTRSRTVSKSPTQGGIGCPNLQETLECNTESCASDCELSSWQPFSDCSSDCGGGDQTRARTVIKPSQSGGSACGALTETRTCNTEACKQDCEITEWAEFGMCSQTCGGGMQSRQRSVCAALSFCSWAECV